MAGVNRVELLGNVGADPEIKSFDSGDRVANLSVATSESWKDKTTGEKKEKVQWHRVVVHNQGLVKVVEAYVKKGSKLFLAGALEHRKFQDQSGQDKYVTEVVLRWNCDLVLCDSRAQASNDPSSTPAGAQQETQPAAQSTAAASEEDEIPF